MSEKAKKAITHKAPERSGVLWVYQLVGGGWFEWAVD
jgi:hypothetical protein